MPASPSVPVPMMPTLHLAPASLVEIFYFTKLRWVRYNSPEPPRHYTLDQKPNLSLHLFTGAQLPHRPNRRPGLQVTPTWWANSSYPPDRRCLPWPPPRRRPASGPAGSFPSERLHFCWCDVSKSPVSTLRTPDTEAETTGGGGEEGPGREGRRLGI